MADESKPNRAPSSDMIDATAAVWLSLRDRGLNSEETARFVRWLQEDARHAEVFTSLDATWKSFDRLSTSSVSNTPGAGIDSPSPRPAPAPKRRIVRRTTLLAAAALVIALLALWPIVRARRGTTETTIGGYQRLELSDGSVAQLNTDTAIRVAFTAVERRVELLRGEAFFEVAKDGSRPFVVRTGLVEVRAVGTTFNVRQRDTGVEVLVGEGQVTVASTLRRAGSAKLPLAVTATPSLLSARQRIIVTRGGVDGVSVADKIILVSPAELQRALAWQERRLEFEATPLGEIVSEFNRYNRRQLVLGDPGLASRCFSGSFRADGCETFARLLETDFGLTVTRERDRIVVGAQR